MSNRTTREQRFKMIELFESGMSMQEVAWEIGCSKTTVVRTLSNYGVDPNSGGEALRVKQLEEQIIERLKAGRTKQSIADELFLARATVFKYQRSLRKRGLL